MPSARYDLGPLLERLTALADPKYRAFNASLVPGVDADSLGVRLPALRAMGKALLKEDWRGFLEASRAHPLLELRMLHGIVLGGAGCDIDEKLRLTDAFLPRVDNWAVCDTFCSSFKPRPAERAAAFEFVRRCAESDAEFRKRFGLVMMMSHYREAPWSEGVTAAYRGFSHPGYYARMGAAWGLATLFLTQREAVLAILRDGVLDDFTHGKAIQKLRESCRVSPEDKAMLSRLRRPRRGTASTLCYIEDGGRYLMLHRTKKKDDANHEKWIGVGGHIEPGETPMACMLREAREETGLALTDCRGRGIVHFRSDRWPDEEMYLFTATRFEGTLTPCDEGELAWIDKGQLRALTLWAGDRVFLDLLASGAPWFELTLEYRGERLARAILNGQPIAADAP